MKQTLLQQAKQYRPSQVATRPPSGLVELAYATIKGDITVPQATSALYPDKKHNSNYYHAATSKLLRVVINAVATGQLSIMRGAE